MQVHRLVALSTGTLLHKARTTAFDLDLTPGSLLDMLHIRTSLPDNLGA